MKKLLSIVREFLPSLPDAQVRPLGNGLINTTYAVAVDGEPKYVLQSINTAIFPDVDGLQNNIQAVTSHLRDKLEKAGETDIDRKVLHFLPLGGENGNKTYYTDPEDGKVWRLMRFIPSSKTLSEVTPETARQAGKAFGRFQSDLADNTTHLVEIIPGFHDMEFRLRQLKDAVKADPPGRVEGVADILSEIDRYADTMTEADRLRREGKMPTRICHCDTKVNNMLYDALTGDVLCVIDLDTVMPSMVFSDYGDFLRTAACSTPEDEPEVDKISFRNDIFEAFTQGYLSSANSFLTQEEKDWLPFAVALFPYMQAVRFLTDWINGDTYYKIAYPTHNLVRTKAQMRLFEKVMEQMPELKKYVASLC